MEEEEDEEEKGEIGGEREGRFRSPSLFPCSPNEGHLLHFASPGTTVLETLWRMEELVIESEWYWKARCFWEWMS